jgi:hypothetical protein
MKVGRPLKYKTVEELQEAIDAYFALNPERPTVTGLALELGFHSRKSFYNYEERPEFLHTIKSATLKIESMHEANLYNGASSGSIFWLKNREWTDKQEQVHSGSLPPIRMEIVDGSQPKDSKQPDEQ